MKIENLERRRPNEPNLLKYTKLSAKVWFEYTGDYEVQLVEEKNLSMLRIQDVASDIIQSGKSVRTVKDRKDQVIASLEYGDQY